MYFKGIEKFDIEGLIANSDKIYAHIDKNRNETLKEHVDLAEEYLHSIINERQLEKVLVGLEDKLCNDLSLEGIGLYREMFLNTIYMHDVGKINCNFQDVKMQNNFFKSLKPPKHKNSNNTNHSMLSAIIFINHYLKKIEEHPNSNEHKVLLTFLFLNAYVISKHHGDLDSFSEFREKLVEKGGEGWRLYNEEMILFNESYRENIEFDEACLKNIYADLGIGEDGNWEASINKYIYERLLSSLLLSCDYYATSHFKHQKPIEGFGGIENIDKFYDIYKTGKINKDIREYEKTSYGRATDFTRVTDINILRNELFLEAEQILIKNAEKGIFFLEAPTGGGKSNISMNLSFKLVEMYPSLNKIFYVYPFNTLIEQNMDNLRKIFNERSEFDDIAVINSVVPIKTYRSAGEDSDVMAEDFEKALLDRQFLHYPMILTTHVSIFNYLFGISKDDLFPLYQMANSIVILDEIQSYKNKIWKEIITFLKFYSDALNIKFIIMSATLPALNRLVDKETETVALIENREKYFSNPIFKNRVKLDFSLLSLGKVTLEELLEHLFERARGTEKNILIEFITKKSADDFYDKLCEVNNLLLVHQKKDIEKITGDDNSFERKRIIDKVKNNKNIILVATQVVEAGVDIDMYIGYKDISMLDSEEQFLGRINRSCLNADCMAYFFDLDDATKVYKGDFRKDKNISLLNDEIREVLTTKEFSRFYGPILQRLQNKAIEYNDNNFQRFIKEAVGGLNFKTVKERMQLIDEQYMFSIFMNRDMEIDGKVLRGEDVWRAFEELLEDREMGYAEKKVRLSTASADLSYFIYKVKNNDFSYEKRIGDIYFIPDGEKYFENNKFIRKKFAKELEL